MKHKELLTKVMRDILSDEKCPIKMNNPATLKMCQRIFAITETTPEKAMPIFIDRFLAYLDQQKSLSEIIEKAKSSNPVPELRLQPDPQPEKIVPQVSEKKPKNNQPEERKENSYPQRSLPSAPAPTQLQTPQQIPGEFMKQQQGIDREQFEILEKMRQEKEQAENLEKQRLEMLRIEKERADKEAELQRDLKLKQIEELHRQNIEKKQQEQPIKQVIETARKPDPIVIDSDEDDVQVPVEVQRKTIIKRVSDTPQLRQYETQVQLQKQQSLLKMQQQKMDEKKKAVDQPPLLKKIQQPIQLQQFQTNPQVCQVKQIQPVVQPQVISVPASIVENNQQKKKEKKNFKTEQAKQSIVNKQQSLKQKCKDCYSFVNEKPNDNLTLSETDRLCAKCCLKYLNPFGKIVKELGYLEYVHQSKNGFTQICSFEFNPATIENMRECIFEVRCVRYSEVGLSEITFPQSYLLQINQSNWQEGKPLLEKSCLHKRKDRSYTYNLPELIKRHHPERGCQFSVEYQVPDSKARFDHEGDIYLFGLFIIRTVDRTELIERALKMEVAAVQKNTCQDIQIDKSKISLNCCYSTVLMNIPARGLYCQHKNCFDLPNYLEIQAKTSQQCYKLSCPICFRNCFQVIVDKFQYSLIRRIRELGLEKYIDSITLDQYGNLDQTDDYQKIILDSSIRQFSDIEKKGYKLKKVDSDDDSESEQYLQTQLKQTQEILTIDD